MVRIQERPPKEEIILKYPKNQKIIIRYDESLIKEPIEQDEMEIQAVNHCCPNCKKYIRSFSKPFYKKVLNGTEREYDEYNCLNCGCIYRIYI